VPDDKMVAVQNQPKKRGRKPGDGNGKSLPATRMGFGESDQDKTLIRRLMTETLESWRKQKVKSDEELAARLDEFFRECAEEGKIPTMEEMALVTGYASRSLYDIETGARKGFSPETKDIIKRAKEFLKTFDAKLVLTGQCNPIIYFFRAKNYYGMKDQTDHVIHANTQDEREVSAEDIAKRYLADPNTIEQTFEDEPKEGAT
jgi:hypothetical protein